MSSWQQWHQDYRDPASDLSQRLAVVQAQVRAWAEGAPSGQLRLISICAGQGHDVAGALAGSSRRTDLTGLLVESDEGNVAAARRNLEEAGLLGIRAVVGDAGDLRTYVDEVPAGLVLVCGVFGNISDEDVRRTLAALPMLLEPGGTVVWTRHRRDPDLTSSIRRWFAESGFDELSFDSPGPDRFAVGTHRYSGETRPLVTRADPLFRFQR